MRLSKRVAWGLWLGAVLCSNTGCELIAQVDRSKIPTPGGGEGGQGGQGGAGGQGGQGGQGGVGGVLPMDCGNGALDTGETCDDGNAAAGDGCSDACAIEPGYACAGEPSVCTEGCGDGTVGGSEACDDGNDVGGDCCSAACQIEPSCEIEPNDTEAEANDLEAILGGGSYLRGHIQPTNDVDFFRFSIPAGATGTFGAETLTGLGGLTCGNPDLDPAFYILDENGMELASADDIDPDNTNYCSQIVVEGLGEGDYYLAIEKSPFAGGVTFGYLNDIALVIAQCGDGVVAGNELCDDGNTADGDGCSALCEIEMASPEVEPNNDATQADANPHFTPNALITGAITPIGDNDWFAIDIPGIADLRIETFDPGSMTTCNTVDSTIALFGPDGATALAGDDDDGIQACSLLDPSTDAGVTRLQPGTYFLRVREFQSDETIPGYDVLVRYTALCGDGVRQPAEECDGEPDCNADCTRMAACGDGIVAGDEMCDDGNTADGDGCSAACMIEGLVTETEPNDTPAEADLVGAYTPPTTFAGSIDPAGDIDIYAIEVPGVADLRVETFDGSGPGSCDGIDTVLQLIAPDGTSELALDDEGGIGSCSLIQGAGAVQLPAGTYYVAVTDYFGDVIPGYTLQVTFDALCGDGTIEGAEECEGGAGCDMFCQRIAVCGDGFIDDAETCDDGNTAGGDGCSATCQLEAAGETEPNNDTVTATSITPGSLRAGSVTPETDVDFYSFSLTAVSDVRVETFGASGPGACVGADTLIELIAADGTTVLASDDDDGTDSCSLIDPGADEGAAHLPAGTYFVRVQSFNNESLIPGYTLLVSLDATCGNGMLEGAEECDGGATCAATCDRVPTCGDTYVDYPEGCDDGNTTAGDGCSASCQLEAVTPEVEPNDISIEADNSSVQLTGNARVTGAIGPVGDQDNYRLTLAAAQALRIEVLDGTAGDCQGDIQSTLRVLGSDGATVLAADDAGGDTLASGIADCSALVVFLPAGTYYLQVEEQGNNAAIPFYLLEVRTQTSAGAESENNGTIAAADTLMGSDVFIAGAHPDAADADFFEIDIAAGQSIRAEILEGAAETCESGEVDSRLTLFDDNGNQLADDDDGGRGLCSTLDGTGSTPRDAGAHDLAAGTYYLRVRSSAFASGTAEQFNYRLAITVR